jgi:diguanylate cyclase (GGDEF)-like protein
MKKLAGIISTQEVDHILETIHAMVALVERDGTLVSWNSAFDSWKKEYTNLSDIFSGEDTARLQTKLASEKRHRWLAKFSLPDSDSAELCDCLTIPTQDGRMLFIAQRSEADSEVHEVIEQLDRRVRLFKIESEQTKKIARNKQIELEAVIAQAKEIAQTDPLTFLLNRRAIIRELQDEVLRAERYKTHLSVSIVDVDDFKSVNDTYGHAVGDEVLKQMAHHLRNGVRHPDVIGRYGGEEFIILLPSSDAEAAAEQAARLIKQVRETKLQVKEHVIQVTLSIGVAQLKIGEESWDNLLNRADSAMYKAKGRGRDCWVVAGKDDS